MTDILRSMFHYTIFVIAYTAFLIVAWEAGALETMYNTFINLF